MGDFTGFSFGGVHSDSLGIIRVSSGDRYNEQLQPEIKDITAEVPGMNGEYYFGSDYGTRTFDIEIAFDHLTETQFRELRRVFGTREIKELIFDERPYKYYMAKLESPVELSYVCFDEPKKVVVGTRVGDERYGVRVANRTTTSTTEQVVDEETGETTEVTTYTTTIERERVYPYEIQDGKERIYKGEGKMTFICYFPFAKSNFKVLPQSGDEYYEGSEEWAISSGLLSNSAYTSYDTYIVPEPPEDPEETPETPYIQVYNPGDVETGFRMYIPFSQWSSGEITLTYKENAGDINADILVIDKPTPQRNGGTNEQPINDIGILIDTNNSLVIGVSAVANNSITTTGNLYNNYIKAGYFFKLQPNLLSTDESKIVITNGNTGIQIFYDYLYF